MFCQSCGNKMKKTDVFCPVCGFNSQGGNQPIIYAVPSDTNAFGVAGFVLAFFIPILGIIFSAIGVSKANKSNGNGSGLSVAGLVLSVIFFIIQIICIIIIIDERGIY